MRKYLILIFLAILLNTCTNLFSTREDQVEKPDPGTISQVFKEPTEPVNILINLSRAIEGANALEYGKLFAGNSQLTERSFIFTGDPNLTNQLIMPWTHTEEKLYFLNMIHSEQNNTPAFRFSFVDSIPARVFTALDSVETDFLEYELKISLPDTQFTYFGFSNFKLFKSVSANEAWYIYAWEDRAKNDAFEHSWTALKARYQ